MTQKCYCSYCFEFHYVKYHSDSTLLLNYISSVVFYLLKKNTQYPHKITYSMSKKDWIKWIKNDLSNITKYWRIQMIGAYDFRDLWFVKSNRKLYSLDSCLIVCLCENRFDSTSKHMSEVHASWLMLEYRNWIWSTILCYDACVFQICQYVYFLYQFYDFDDWYLIEDSGR